jgi:3-phosphoshikimate 1-carboxyvinyltransferase
MLQGFGYAVERSGPRICVVGGGALHATSLTVPADLSSAAFFLVGASIAPGSDLVLEGVGINPTRTGVIDVLRLMGADISLEHERQAGGEPVAALRGIHIPPELVPLAIDEFPALFVAAACAQGETVLTGAAELRVKESDRIQVMADALQALGIVARPTPDGMLIQGGTLGAGRVHSHGDHRVAMSCAIAALRASGPVIVEDCSNVATSFPGFVTTAQAVGLTVSAEPGGADD